MRKVHANHGRDHAPDGADPIPGIETTDGSTSVIPTSVLEIGSGITLSNPSTGVARLSSQAPVIAGRMSSGTNPTFVGLGCTAVRTGTGAYTVTFTPPLSVIPAITISAYGDAANIVNFASANQNGSLASVTGFTVSTYNPGVTVARDCGWDFIAVPVGGTSQGSSSARFPTQSNAMIDTKYNAFPWLCYLANGSTLIAVYRDGASHTSVDGKVIKQTSTDGGVTWSAKSTVKTPAGGQDFRDPSICLLASGRLIINYFNYNGAAVTDLLTTYSDDNGATWSVSTSIFSSGYTSWTATSAAILACSDGTLVMPVYGRNTSDTDDRMGVMRSTNGGTSWTLVNVGAANSKTNEATLIDFGGGNLRAYIRYEVAASPIKVSDSTDNGATWSALTNLSFNVSPGRPFAARLNNETIFLMYRSTASSRAAYRYSLDGGTTWTDEAIYSYSQYQYAGGFVKSGSDLLVAAVGLEVSASESRILFFSWTYS